MPTWPAGLLLAAALSSLGAQVTPDKPSPAAQPQTPTISSETRGDIFMAEKKYREAIEAYREGPAQNGVVQNKLGIAYQHEFISNNNGNVWGMTMAKYKQSYFHRTQTGVLTNTAVISVYWTTFAVFR